MKNLKIVGIRPKKYNKKHYDIMLSGMEEVRSAKTAAAAVVIVDKDGGVYTNYQGECSSLVSGIELLKTRVMQGWMEEE